MKSRGNAKSLTAFVQSLGRRNGKGLATAGLEAQHELSVNPPATAEEAEVFCRINVRRCNVNLANAKDRGDKRAVMHLERKLAVYEYLYRIAKCIREEQESATTCPVCRVHAVGSDGVCACCGALKEDSE